MDTAPPSSLSVYRGQSRKGIGEGPDNPIAQGEQYLAAHPSLAKDGELLASIRPWMSLDSDPADHQRLGDRLEGWSCFHYRNLQFVVRLASAGTYDRRAAYFAHGRAWSLGSFMLGFDPGLHLGRSDAFETPWRDDSTGERVVEPSPALVRPQQIAAEPAVAAIYLGHLFQAVVRRYPLVIAVTVADFLAESPVHALVSFCRGALPADLKIECRIRIYTRLPGLFLTHLQANLIVVPEEMAGDALAARRDATLLDRQGNKRAGKELDPAALAYAEAVVERAIRLPEGLPLFSERFRDRRGNSGLPSAGDARAVQITYNLAYALSGPDEQRGDMFRSYLPKAAQKYGPGLDWKRLIEVHEWGSFPPEALIDVLLLDSSAFQPGAHEFQEAVEGAVARLGLEVDAQLEGWWNPAEPWKLRRLLELLAHRPPLISPQAAVTRTSHLSIREIAAAGPPEGVLEIELDQGTLAHRAHESADLARLAHEPRIFDILSRAVLEGKLETAWARSYVTSAQGDALTEAAQRFLRISGSWDGWRDVPQVLLDRLRSFNSDLIELGPLIVNAAREVDPQRHLALYLRLADLLSRIDEESGNRGESILLPRLWKTLPSISDREEREFLVGAALGGGWRCLPPKSLLLGKGLRVPWLAEFADRLVASNELCEGLAAPALLELGAKLQEDESHKRLFALLDRLLRAEQEETTGALIRSGWWYFWRLSSRLTESEIHQAAVAWMISDAWLEKGIEATYEAWEQAAADLPRDVPGSEMERLCQTERGRRVPGPCIPPFEDEQFGVLVVRAADLGALAELAEAIRSDQRFQWVPMPHRYVLGKSRFDKPAMNRDAVAWLMESRGSTQLPSLSLRESADLHRLSGHRSAKALVARIQSVVEALEKHPEEALAAAAEPYLWDNPDFLEGLAEWMCRKGSVAHIGRNNAISIDQYVHGAPVHYLRTDPRELVRDLTRLRLDRAAQLLSAAVYAEVQEEDLASAVIRALCAGAHEDPCWEPLAQKIRQVVSGTSSPEQHPIVLIAKRIRDRRELSRDQERSLAERGWDTFEAAAHDYPILMSFVPHKEETWPAFVLAMSMAGAGAMGKAALRMIFAAASRGHRSEVDWWQTLLKEIRRCRRRGSTTSADDREEVAVTLILESIGDLGKREQQTFWRALEKEAEAYPEWSLPAEFGVGRR